MSESCSPVSPVRIAVIQYDPQVGLEHCESNVSRGLALARRALVDLALEVGDEFVGEQQPALRRAQAAQDLALEPRRRLAGQGYDGLHVKLHPAGMHAGQRLGSGDIGGLCSMACGIERSQVRPARFERGPVRLLTRSGTAHAGNPAAGDNAILRIADAESGVTSRIEAASSTVGDSARAAAD